MNENILRHYGILGMKWGIRRTPAQLRQVLSPGKTDKRTEPKSDDQKKPKGKASSSGSAEKKTMKEMTDNELKEKISRLELEKRYKDLSKNSEQAKSKKGQAFVMDVLEKSGKNIATQFTTYMMGAAVNKIIGSEIVNPKKGQKDK